MLGVMAEQVAVIGAGALGGVLAEAACAAGHDVTVCVRTPIPSLTVERDGTARRVPARIAGDPGGVGLADWVLLTTKGYQTASVEPWLRALAGPRTVVVVVQNGVEHAERLAVAARRPAGPVLPALSYVSAKRSAPGRVRHVYGDTMIVPRDADGERFGALLAGGAVRVEPSADFLTAAWRKLLVNVAANPVTALTGRPLGVLGEPGIAELMRGLLAEAVAVATAAGARLSAADVTATMDFYAGLGPAQGTSMLEDRAAGRPLEYEEITGAVVRAAARHKLDVPLNQAVLALLSAVSPAA
jgi:2-dehydropantoate 2-reductase